MDESHGGRIWKATKWTLAIGLIAIFSWESKPKSKGTFQRATTHREAKDQSESQNPIAIHQPSRSPCPNSRTLRLQFPKASSPTWKPPPIQSECMGMWIDSQWILTAAHCLPNPDLPRALQIDDGFHLQSYRALATRFHPSVDALLIQVRRIEPKVLQHGCSISPPFAWRNQCIFDENTLETNYLHSESLPWKRFFPSKGLNQPRDILWFQETYRNIRTIDAENLTGCLNRGSSGLPVFSTRTQDKDRPVAMLIRGAKECKGSQTLLRLDRLAPWIIEQSSST